MYALCLSPAFTLAMYVHVCMHAPMFLTPCTAKCAVWVFVQYSHYYFLCTLSLLPLHMHFCMFSLQYIQGSGDMAIHLQWWSMGSVALPWVLTLTFPGV